MEIIYRVGDNLFEAKDISDLELEVTRFFADKGVIATVGADGDKVIASYPEAYDIDAAEDERIVLLYCQKRNFTKARKVVQELLKKAPYNSDAYRLFAQIEMEDGNIDIAIEKAKDSLRFNPANLYALILLGNLLARDKGLLEEGLVWYKKAVESYPESVLAVNNYAGTLLQKKDADKNEVVELFKKAISLDNTYLNSYYALSGILIESGKLREAFDLVQDGLKKGVSRPENPAPIKKIMMESLVRLSRELSKSAEKTILETKLKEVENVGGVSIDIEEDKSLGVPAKMELAERYRTKNHKIKWNSELCKNGSYYYLIHELEKQLLRIEAKLAGCSASFMHDRTGLEKFKEKTSLYITEKLKSVTNVKDVDELLLMLMSGMGGQIMNTPLDYIVFDRLFNKNPELRPLQVCAVYELAIGSIASVSAAGSNLFPKNVVRVNRVLNGVTFNQYRDLIGLDIVDELSLPADELRQANELYKKFVTVLSSFKPGDEWKLVEDVLSELRCEGIFKVEYEKTDAQKEEATKTFQERFSSGDDIALNMAIKMYMVDAIKSLRVLPVEQVKKIAAEIAYLGMRGIKPDQKSGYSVPALDNRDMSGCQMLAYYYVSWKIGFPEAISKLGLPFDKEYEEALSLIDMGM